MRLDRSGERLLELVVQKHPPFSQCPEYHGVFDDGNDDLPGVVLAAFGRYLVRIAASGSDRSSEAFETLEWLATSGDAEITNAVVLEIRGETGDTLAAFVEGLRPESRQLWERTPAHARA